MVEIRIGRRSFTTLCDQTVFSGTKIPAVYVEVELFLQYYVVELLRANAFQSRVEKGGVVYMRQRSNSSIDFLSAPSFWFEQPWIAWLRIG
jgi:hypothetical protein